MDHRDGLLNLPNETDDVQKAQLGVLTQHKDGKIYSEVLLDNGSRRLTAERTVETTTRWPYVGKTSEEARSGEV